MFTFHVEPDRDGYIAYAEDYIAQGYGDTAVEAIMSLLEEIVDDDEDPLQ